MAKKKIYDASLKSIITNFPSDYTQWLGMGPALPMPMNTDLSTIEASVDGLLQLEQTPDVLAHLEMQAGYKSGLIERELWHNVLAWHHFGKVIQSVIIYLRKEVCQAHHTGELKLSGVGGQEVIHFRYQQVKIWECDWRILMQRLGTMPLAPLAAVKQEDVPGLIEQIEHRIEPLPEETQGLIYTATYALGGLRYDRAFLDMVMRKVDLMKESVTYLAILNEGARLGRKTGERLGRVKGELRGERRGVRKGRNEALHEAIETYATARFGQADSATLDALAEIHDEARLNRMFANVRANSWAELLATP